MSGHDYDAVNYWKANLRLIFGSLIVWASCLMGLRYCFAPCSPESPLAEPTSLLVRPTGFDSYFHRVDLPLRLADEQAR